MQEKDNITQFTDKYTKKGVISEFLVSIFFKTIKDNIPVDVKNIIEVGCGAGYSTQKLRSFLNHNIDFSACDISPELITLARKMNPDVSCKVGSIYKLPYPDHSFDLVICLEVLEHLEEPEHALLELVRISNKYLIISTPNEPLWRTLNLLRGKYCRQFGNTPGHINHWSVFNLRKLASKYFDIIICRNPIPWTIIYGKIKKYT
jgi:ubiquinone/menaquinone biosynthesis C-methylase UbiE